MKLKKLLALLLCVTMIAAVLTGCNQSAKSPFVSNDAAATDTSGATPSASSLNFAGAYASLDPKTVMMTINGKDVTWDELFYFISYNVYQLQSQGKDVSDWSAVDPDANTAEVTYKDSVLNAAADLALQYAAINYGAEQLKVTMTDADKASVQSDWDAQVTKAGSEEAFLALLQSQYCSKELFTMLEGFRYLARDCFTSLYGENGSKLTNEEVADDTAGDGYLMAKHILFFTTVTDETGAQTPMPEDQKAKVKEKAETVLNELKNYKGKDFNAYFDELMTANSDDKGGIPNGYLFQSGEMVSEFENATKALQIGQFTPELVESKYGYHIIYRLPIDYDAAPSSSANTSGASLRYLTAQNMFNAVADTWKSSLNITYSDKYKALDFSKIFAAG